MCLSMICSINPVLVWFWPLNVRLDNFSSHQSSTFRRATVFPTCCKSTYFYYWYFFPPFLFAVSGVAMLGDRTGQGGVFQLL